MDITNIATCSLGTENNRQTTVGGLLEKFSMIKTRKKEMISQNGIPKSLRDLENHMQFQNIQTYVLYIEI